MIYEYVGYTGFLQKEMRFRPDRQHSGLKEQPEEIQVVEKCFTTANNLEWLKHGNDFGFDSLCRDEWLKDFEKGDILLRSVL